MEGEGAIEVHAAVLLGHWGGGVLCLYPFCHKVHQCLGLDFCLWDKCYVEPCDLESPLCNPSHVEPTSPLTVPNRASKAATRGERL
jgi:hypothetical protein